MSDTPETNEIETAYEQQRESVGGIIEHARELERELNAAKAEIARLEKWTTVNGIIELEQQLKAAKALAEQNGKLAHDNGIVAMKHREQRVILQAALEEIATGVYSMKTAYDHIAPNAIKQANYLDEQP